MTSTPNNPPQDANAASPGKALRNARLLIASGLCVGIAVFAVLVIQDLEAGPSTSAMPSDFGTSDRSPTQAAAATNGSPLAAIMGVDPAKYPPILRANPHPGQFTPFLRADPYGIPPHQQIAAGVVTETCDYKVRDASLVDLLAHYNEQAKLAGMKPIKRRPTSDERPGGMVASWSDGRRGLQVTAWPLRSDQPVPAPPLRPATPLRWVVKYSYPAPTR